MTETESAVLGSDHDHDDRDAEVREHAVHGMAVIMATTRVSDEYLGSHHREWCVM